MNLDFKNIQAIKSCILINIYKASCIDNISSEILRDAFLAVNLFNTFFKAIRPQAARHVVPRDCFITTSISKEVVPEMVSLLILQHQIPKFCIKHGKFHKKSIHIPSLHPSLSVPIGNLHHNPRITENKLLN